MMSCIFFWVSFSHSCGQDALLHWLEEQSQGLQAEISETVSENLSSCKMLKSGTLWWHEKVIADSMTQPLGQHLTLEVVPGAHWLNPNCRHIEDRWTRRPPKLPPTIWVHNSTRKTVTPWLNGGGDDNVERQWKWRWTVVITIQAHTKLGNGNSSVGGMCGAHTVCLGLIEEEIRIPVSSTWER